MNRLNLLSASLTLAMTCTAFAAEYHHPTGLTLQLPQGWTTQNQNGTAVLVPGDQRSNARGPTEVFLLLIGPTMGIRSVESEQMIQLLDEQMKQISPALHRTTEPAAYNASDRRGILMSWEGTTPDGHAIAARMYSVMDDGFVGAILAIGDARQINERAAAVDAMASGMTFERGSIDRNVVGRWSYTKSSSYVSGDFSMATATTSTVVLAENGQCAMRDSSQVAGGTSDVGAQTGDDGNTRGGIWFASDGTILVITEQAVICANYATDGATLRVVSNEINRAYQRDQ